MDGLAKARALGLRDVDQGRGASAHSLGLLSPPCSSSAACSIPPSIFGVASPALFGSGVAPAPMWAVLILPSDTFLVLAGGVVGLWVTSYLDPPCLL